MTARVRTLARVRGAARLATPVALARTRAREKGGARFRLRRREYFSPIHPSLSCWASSPSRIIYASAAPSSRLNAEGLFFVVLVDFWPPPQIGRLRVKGEG